MRIFLKGGVDQVSPMGRAAPGTLRDCYNYEITSEDGLSYMEGFERFDGRISPSTRDIWEATIATASITGTFQANENMSWVNGSDSGDLGVVISVTTSGSNTIIRFAYWLPTDALPSGATVTGDASAATFSATPTFAALEDVATDADDYFDQLKSSYDILRGVITPVPGSGPVTGIKWYKNQMTAIRDYYKYFFDGGSISEPEVGQHIIVADGNAGTTLGDEGIVREVTINSGTFGGSNAAGYIIVEPYNNSFDFETELDAGFDNQIYAMVNVHFTSGSEEPAQGDVLEGATSTDTVTVWRVELQSGTWAGGDAAGIVYCYTHSGALTDGENMDIQGGTANVMTLDSADHTIFTIAQGAMDYVSTDNEGHDMAGMYRSSRTGWQKVDLGWEANFDTGYVEPPLQPLGDGQVIVHENWTDAGTQRDLGGWNASAGTELNAVTIEGGAYVYAQSTTTTGTLVKSDEYFCVRNFGFSLPTDSTVTGVELRIKVMNTEAPDDRARLCNIRLYMNDAGSSEGGEIDDLVEKNQGLGDITDTNKFFVFGGKTDLWGADITQTVVEDANFGVKFKLEWDDSIFSGSSVRVDYIELRVYYLADDQNQIHFYSGSTDYATADCVTFNKTEGFFNADGEAEGTVQFYNISKLGFSDTSAVYDSDPTSAGTEEIFSLVDGLTRVSLPGSALLATEGSKYQMVAENVYASQDLESIYGVSGADRAFKYDAEYFYKIYSGLEADIDKPRHVSIFQFRLWLGYSWGELAISVGGEPQSFDGTLNAVAGGVGKSITGLAPWSGQVLGILTKTGIFGIKAVGADFDQQVISANSGAIEYTAQDIGNRPMFTDSRGVHNATTAEQYGDFQLGRLTTRVARWLLPRLQGLVKTKARDWSVVNTSLNRAKNQYRIYFADGFRASITMNEPPEITYQQLYLNSDKDQYIKVLATDSDIDDLYTDRVFFTIAVRQDYDHGDALGYVYEDDRGRSFDTGSINHWVELNPLYGENLEQYKWTNIRLRLHGLAYGHAVLSRSVAFDKTHPAAATGGELTLGAETEAVRVELDDFDEDTRIKGRGKLMSLRFEGTSDKELPHILQELSTDNEKPGRKDM